MPVTAPEPTRPARRALHATSSDAELVARVRAGDAAAYEAIFRRYHQPLLAYCRHMLGGRDEAEDALQQAFIRAHRALCGGNPPRELRPWLYAIARNCCLTAAAARRPTATLDDDEPGLDGLSEEVARREELRELVSDLGRLPEEQRSALLLAELEDLTHAEIAEIVGCPVTKVKALVYQARVALLADRSAREASCRDIREELSVARGGVLRRGPLRRHLRMCAGCREFQLAVGDQRRSLAIVLPVAGSAGLAAKVLGPASAIHAGLAGGAVLGAPAAATGAGAAAASTSTAATAAATSSTLATVGAAGSTSTLATTGAAASTSTLASVGAAGSTSTLATAGATASASTLATAGAAAATAATGGGALSTGSLLGGGLLAKLAVGGAVATLASAGALAVHHRQHRTTRVAAPARLTAVKTRSRLPGGAGKAASPPTPVRPRRRRTSAGAPAAAPAARRVKRAGGGLLAGAPHSGKAARQVAQGAAPLGSLGALRLGSSAATRHQVESGSLGGRRAGSAETTPSTRASGTGRRPADTTTRTGPAGTKATAGPGGEPRRGAGQSRKPSAPAAPGAPGTGRRPPALGSSAPGPRPASTTGSSARAVTPRPVVRRPRGRGARPRSGRSRP